MRPKHSSFLRYQSRVKTGEGDIAADIHAGQERRLEKDR